jgi:hypothetical protein
MCRARLHQQTKTGYLSFRYYRHPQLHGGEDAKEVMAVSFIVM